jgi:hypothetical protein
VQQRPAHRAGRFAVAFTIAPPQQPRCSYNSRNPHTRTKMPVQNMMPVLPGAKLSAVTI